MNCRQFCSIEQADFWQVIWLNDFQLCEHLFEYISTHYTVPPISLQYGRGGEFDYKVLYFRYSTTFHVIFHLFFTLNKDIFCVNLWNWHLSLAVYSMIRLSYTAAASEFIESVWLIQWRAEIDTISTFTCRNQKYWQQFMLTYRIYWFSC